MGGAAGLGPRREEGVPARRRPGKAGEGGASERESCREEGGGGEAGTGSDRHRRYLGVGPPPEEKGLGKTGLEG